MRLLWLVPAAFFLLYAAWFFYDGFVGFPNQKATAQTLLTELQQARDSQDAAAVQTKSSQLQTIPRRTEMDIVIQKMLGFMFAGAGAVFVILALWPRTPKPPLASLAPAPSLPPPPL